MPVAVGLLLPIDNLALGVLLIDGAVRVSNAAGERILSRPGQGTNIATSGAARGPVTLWPQDKVDRALAAAAFQYSWTPSASG